MTQSLMSLKVRPYFVGLMVTLFMLLAQQQQPVQAGSSSGDLGRDIDEGIDGYQQGNTDGRAAGTADYPYRNSDCPSGYSSAYCLGWDGGYATGFNAQKTIDESGRRSGNGDSNDDD
jgi:hypothetical protein